MAYKKKVSLSALKSLENRYRAAMVIYGSGSFCPTASLSQSPILMLTSSWSEMPAGAPCFTQKKGKRMEEGLPHPPFEGCIPEIAHIMSAYITVTIT